MVQGNVASFDNGEVMVGSGLAVRQCSSIVGVFGGPKATNRDLEARVSAILEFLLEVFQRHADERHFLMLASVGSRVQWPKKRWVCERQRSI
jgi:hypothetical protein